METEMAAVIVSGVVALATIFSSYAQAKKRLAHERRIADLEGVRGTLDDAAVELHKTAYLLDEVRSQVLQHTPGFFNLESGTKTYIEHGRRGEALDELAERLHIRFGRTHEVSIAFDGACAASLDIYRAAGLVRLEDDPDGSGSARYAIDELYDKIRARLIEQRKLFDDARNQFVDAAHVTSGARLGGKDSGSS